MTVHLSWTLLWWVPALSLLIGGLFFAAEVLFMGESPRRPMRVEPDWSSWQFPRQPTVSQPPEWWYQPSSAEEAAVLRAEALLAAAHHEECTLFMPYPADNRESVRIQILHLWSKFTELWRDALQESESWPQR